MMSPKRHPEDDVLVRSYAVTHPPGLGLSTRRYPWFQIVHALAGVMSVHTDDGSWIVPPHRAVWIPADHAHRISTTGAVTMRTLYFSRRWLSAPGERELEDSAPGERELEDSAPGERELEDSAPGERELEDSAPDGVDEERCHGLMVSPLMRELIVEVCQVGVLLRSNARHTRLAHVVLDQLKRTSTPALRLPMPKDPRAIRLANRLLHDPRSSAPVDDIVRAVGASRRTLERLFVSETQLTLGRWRHRLRMIEAIKLLADGCSVVQTAAEIGFVSPSAFVIAFKRDLGTTPGRYFSLESDGDAPSVDDATL